MRVYTCVVHGQCVEVVIETVWAYSSEEGGKEREWKEAGKKRRGKKRKRGERGFWGIVGVFGFLFDCVFSLHPFLPPFFNPPCHHAPSPHSHSPITLHTTSWHTQHATQPRVCAVVFVVCVSLSARSFLTQPTHATPSNHLIHHTWRHQCMSQ